MEINELFRRLREEGVTGNEKYSNIGNGTAAKNVTSVQHNW